MGCAECDKFEKEGKVYYYRLGKANIGIIACEEHFLQVKKILDKEQ